ncbi:outer membrane protein assembly factor BamA [Alphaproteobacteria bacterium]|nr:outer membrane protein assembly factor BamA [Alphaproteobacteria bacterium]
MHNLNFFLKTLITILLIFFINLSFSYADPLTIKKIIVSGEKRLSKSFILNFLPSYPNTKFNDEVLNQFTKDLYNTGLFSDVNLEIKKDILQIIVIEHPIINEVYFTGNDLLDNEQLNDIVMISPRDTLNLDKINEAVDKIRTEYQKIGRYLAEVKPQKIKLGEGRVNLNFVINEGSLLTVKNINFVGNQNFSNNELKSIISTKEDAWYKLFGSNKFVPERLEYDKKKLKEFYNQRGYIDFKVEIARGDLLPDISGFNLNFIVKEGKRYTVNNLVIESSLINDNKKKILLKEIYLKKEEYFNSRALDASIKFLVEEFELLGFNFIRVFPKIKKDKNLVNILFSIKEGSEKYINKITIVGNTRTNDNVIRRELTLLEGDPFNKSKLTTSISALRRLGYFQSVNYRLDEIDSNLIDIILDVKETNTGSVSFGVGYSSLNNTSFSFGLSEKNFLGEGKKVRLQADLSEKKSTYNIGVTEPYFLDRHLSLYGDIFNQETENKKGDIKSSSSGFGFGIGFINESLTQSFKYKLSTSETTTSSTSTAASETGEEGIEIITSSITHSISKDTRDSYFNPTSGYNWKFSNTVAGIGGDATFYKSILNSRIYYPIDYGDYVFGFKSGAGFITAIDDKITSSNRFFLGGKKLRGFDNGGLGPRDTGNNQAVGGNNFYNFSFELKSNKFMPEDTGLEWLVFSDIGSIWGTDYETNVKGFDDIEPRITNGFGLAMVTPIGPLQMIWGFPVQSQDYDIEENFQFSIGTSF